MLLQQGVANQWFVFPILIIFVWALPCLCWVFLRNDAGESWTFGETYDKSVKFSDGLRGKYYPDCQVLGIFLPNCIEYPVVFSGSARAGIVTTTINPTYTSYEIGKQVGHGQAFQISLQKDISKKISIRIQKIKLIFLTKLKHMPFSPQINLNRDLCKNCPKVIFAFTKLIPI